MQINEPDTAQVGMRDTFPVFGTGRAIESVRLDGLANWRRDRSARITPRRSNHNVYPGLDLLRGFAAISVVGCHVIAHFQVRSFPISSFIDSWFRVGWMGVDLFFVISGFVITLSALKLFDSSRVDFARSFARRRLARIVPLHYMTCLFFVIFLTPALMFSSDFWRKAIAHLLFIHNLSSSTFGSINGPNWSLALEMQFYLLILLVTPWLRRSRPLPVLAGCVAISWTWRAVMFHLYHGRQSSFGLDLTWLTTSQLPGTLDEFGFGIVLAMLLDRDAGGRMSRALQKTRWLWPLAATLLVMITMHFFWKNVAIWTNWKMVVFWRALLAATCCSAVIAMCAINDGWFLTLTTPLRYIGKISYGIYLWHSLVITALKPILAQDPARAFLWTLCLTLLLASLSWHFFEQPVMERFTHKGKRIKG